MKTFCNERPHARNFISAKEKCFKNADNTGQIRHVVFGQVKHTRVTAQQGPHLAGRNFPDPETKVQMFLPLCVDTVFRGN